QVERVAQQALRDRIGAEITTTRGSVESARQLIEQLEQQAVELREREAQLIDELQATRLELAPMDEELSQAELRRTDMLADRRTEEARLVERRGVERAARE